MFRFIIMLMRIMGDIAAITSGRGYGKRVRRRFVRRTMRKL